MPKRPLVAIGLAGLVWALAGCAGNPVTEASLALVNGRVWTGDPSKPWAEAVAVAGDRIAAVGTTAGIRKRTGPRVETLDLGGRLLLPGFVDSHVHFVNGGASLLSIQLRDASSREEFVRRIAEQARALPKGEWILNGDWDHQAFTPPELPRREWIDAATPDHPVCVNRLDGHMILANSLALRLAGVTKETPAPPGGEIVRDPATGEPTGILKDAAMDVVYAKVPAATPAQLLRSVEAALRLAAEKGVTSVHDVSGEAGLAVYRDLLRTGRLTTRIYFYLPISDPGLAEAEKLRPGPPDGFLRFAGLKGFADGSLGSKTAYFFDPYADDPSTSGLLHGQMFPEGAMEKRIAAADAEGLQCAIHAIGDRANAIVLDIFERTAAARGRRDRRFRIEHAQHLRPADFARFARLGVVASVQPYHAVDDGRWAERTIGAGRARTTYAFRSFLDAGVRLAFGSDWPVAPMDPILGIHAAVTRATLDGRRPDGWVPEEKITVEEAVRAFTAGGAYAEFAEGEKGAIAAGKLADFACLDKDIFVLPPAEIRDARVIMTIVGGRVVFRRTAP